MQKFEAFSEYMNFISVVSHISYKLLELLQDEIRQDKTGSDRIGGIEKPSAKITQESCGRIEAEFIKFYQSR